MTNDELDLNVLRLLQLHVGKTCRIGRWELVEKIFNCHVPDFERNDGNLKDREIRLSVGRLRKQGHLICELGDGAGRWIASNEHEFWEFYHWYAKPIRARANTLNAMRDAAKQKFPNLLQPSLFTTAGKIEELDPL